MRRKFTQESSSSSSGWGLKDENIRYLSSPDLLNYIVSLELSWIDPSFVILNRTRLYFKAYCVDKNILSGSIVSWSPCWYFVVNYYSALSGPSSHLETLPDQLSHLAVLRVLLAADDEVDESLGVSQHWGSVGLGHSNQTGAVNLETSSGWLEKLLTPCLSSDQNMTTLQPHFDKGTT